MFSRPKAVEVLEVVHREIHHLRSRCSRGTIITNKVVNVIIILVTLYLLEEEPVAFVPLTHPPGPSLKAIELTLDSGPQLMLDKALALDVEVYYHEKTQVTSFEYHEDFPSDVEPKITCPYDVFQHFHTIPYDLQFND